MFSARGLLVELASIISMSSGGVLYSFYGIRLVFTCAGSMEVLSAVIGFFLYTVVSRGKIDKADPL